MRTLAGLSGGVTAVGAGRLLDVEGPLAYSREKRQPVSTCPI
jgi:hypothetical protein